MALGEGRGRIYIVEPVGTIKERPNVTDKKFPGNPTSDFALESRLRIIGEVGLAWPRP